MAEKPNLQDTKLGLGILKLLGANDRILFRTHFDHLRWEAHYSPEIPAEVVVEKFSSYANSRLQYILKKQGASTLLSDGRNTPSYIVVCDVLLARPWPVKIDHALKYVAFCQLALW